MRQNFSVSSGMSEKSMVLSGRAASFAKRHFLRNHSASEQRFVTVGTSIKNRILLVAHTDREDNVRIISVRKATRRERKYYEEKN